MNAPVTPRERPILFSGEMVRQILAGEKTQTRRPVKPQPSFRYPGTARLVYGVHPMSPSMFVGTPAEGMIDGENRMGWLAEDWCGNVVGEAEADAFRCPYGAPGDRLWVRETFWSQHDTDTDGYQTIDCGPDLTGPEYHPGWEYCATPACEAPPKPEREQTVAPHEGPPVPGEWWLAPPDDWNGEDDDRERRGTWVFLPWQLYTKHPSIFMPRRASRLTLEVTGVRVERVQDISEKDILAEGVTVPIVSKMTGIEWAEIPDLYTAWRLGWTHIYGAESWGANPWIWVVEFRRVENAHGR